MGKGSKPRTPSPFCSPEQFASNWDDIFGKKDKKPVEEVKRKEKSEKPKTLRKK